jgi:EAL domain-containing protein (putative c-di-GMP-specific phosphodiesterase class I)
MNAKASLILTIERSLQQAIERQEFSLHYQPLIEVATRRVVATEALIRWQHPELGELLPAQFIPIAEERGLMVPIGDWVMQQACKQNRAWHEAGLPRVPVAVNVSALQFRENDFPRRVAQILEDAPLAPEYLALELSESTIVQSGDTAVAKIKELKALGVHLSIDDVGTGYSNLGYLKHLPVDRLKLDQSFVRGLATDTGTSIISGAVLDMAKTLRLRVVAEGVETQSQVDFLRARDCAEAQGYYFSKPLVADDLARFVLRSALSRSAVPVAARA